jgi:MFS family permease
MVLCELETIEQGDFREVHDEREDRCRYEYFPNDQDRQRSLTTDFVFNLENARWAPLAISSDPASASLWQPLKVSTFRNLLIANVVSDIGAFMQSVGAAWLMVSLNGGPMYVALTQTAAALPFFLLALPAGAVGDIVDRRKIILFTQIWMMVVAAVLAVLTLGGTMSPVLLLLLTFALSAGDAFESPTWRAVLPELVQKEDLPAASALNGIEFNLARAVGPALAGAVVAFAGVGVAFLSNAFSFLGVIVVVARWKRPVVRRATPPETVAGATRAAIRYVRYSPGVLRILVRGGTAMFFASALLALLPSLAHRVSGSPIGYGVLLGGFGGGAVAGALVMQRARARWPADVIVSAGIAAFGLATMAAGALRLIWLLGIVMVVGGAAWVSFISLFNVEMLGLAPDWVRARVLAVAMLTFQGAVAGGSAAWGALAVRVGVDRALLWAGAGALVSTVLALFLRLPNVSLDLTPWNHWRIPAVGSDIVGSDNDGPILVTVEYDVASEHAADFIAAMREYGRIRRRDGASRWGICRDLEVPDRYIETFIVSSWAEHVRQHDRLTRSDSQVEERLGRYVAKVPSVRHLLYL